MKLKSLLYKEENWSLENIQFEDVCLIVGKNSTGKSKTLEAIDGLGKTLLQKQTLYTNQGWEISFIDNENDDIIYNFREYYDQDSDKVVILENIRIGNNNVLTRKSSESASIFNFLDNKEETIYPPSNKLVIHTNRDLKKYPFLEKIIDWAEQSYGFKFGNISPDKPFDEQRYELLLPAGEIPELFSQLDETSREKVKKSINSIGFLIERIDLVDFVSDKQKFLRIKEQKITDDIYLHWLSQGLFRCLSLLIFLEYLIAKKKPATVIIDDLCEGLDYDRATKLGKLVFEKCLQNNIQLIATSNDAFIMEAVDLKYWNVLQRDGSVVTSLNAQNHPDLFNSFKFTGLSNFDFFASDYIAQKVEA